MPANKNKLLRMQVIIQLMRQKKYPNYTRFMAQMRHQDVAGAYTLSDKTFRRDVEDLITEFRAPVEYDGSAKGYYLKDIEWYNEALMVEPFEMRSTLLGQKTAEALMPEPLRSEIGKAVRSLLARNETGLADGADLDTMQIINPVNLPLSADVFCAVYTAWEKRQRLQVSYHSATGRQSELVIEPHVLAWHAGIWYLKGINLGAPDQTDRKPLLTTLALHRIGAATIIPLCFATDPEILDAVKAKKLFNFPRWPAVRLQIMPAAVRQIRERFASQPDCIETQPDGTVLLTLTDLAEYEAVELILWTRGEIKVIAPEPLRATILRIAKALQDNQQ